MLSNKCLEFNSKIGGLKGSNRGKIGIEKVSQKTAHDVLRRVTISVLSL